MAKARSATRSEGSVGELLQHWRKARRLSQLALATEAEVSARHLCFLETGRAKPSREMLLLLSEVLDVPLRERNTMLLAAGFAPAHSEARLDAPELAVVKSALDAILRQQEPFPAVVMNRDWDVLYTNDAAARFFGLLLGKKRASGPSNVLRMMFDPRAVRPYVSNWEEVAESLVRRVRRESVGGGDDDNTKKLLAEILAFPGVPEAWKSSAPGPGLLPVVPVRFKKGELRFDFFSTVTTLGTPQDVTVQEIRLECFFPANDETARAARRLAR